MGLYERYGASVVSTAVSQQWDPRFESQSDQRPFGVSDDSKTAPRCDCEPAKSCDSNWYKVDKIMEEFVLVNSFVCAWICHAPRCLKTILDLTKPFTEYPLLPVQMKSRRFPAFEKPPEVFFFGTAGQIVSSVCQSIATTVLDPRRHNTQQLCAELWERLARPSGRFQQTEIQVKDKWRRLIICSVAANCQFALWELPWGALVQGTELPAM